MVGYLKIFLRLGGVYNFFLGGGGGVQKILIYISDEWKLQNSKLQ